MDKKFFAIGLLFFISIVYMAAIPASHGSLLYKNYVIRQDKGRDILCAPYTVKKNDWILKIFKLRGEISKQDFPEFLKIFKRINPKIRNIDLIRPGESILIPLKRISTGALPGQSSGVVTIPFVSISKAPERVMASSRKYMVQRGDCISKLIAPAFGSYGTESYQEGVKLLRIVNPRIKNINLIYAGQTIYLPDSSIKNESWCRSILKDSENIIKADYSKTARTVQDTVKTTAFNSLKKVASILNANLLDNGIYNIPIKDSEEDFGIDLSTYPIIELGDGTKVLLSKGDNLSEDDRQAIKSLQENLLIASIPEDASEKEILDSILTATGIDNKKSLIFTDNEIEIKIKCKWIVDRFSIENSRPCRVCIIIIENPSDQTPDSITRYLAQHDIIIEEIFNKSETALPKKENIYVENRTPPEIIHIDAFNHRKLVAGIASVMEYNFTQNVGITFPYAGIQVEAVSNLLLTEEEIPLFIDFGDFFGNAIPAIKNEGMNIIQINKKDGFNLIINKLFKAVDVTYRENPVFYIAKKNNNFNISILLPGFFVSATETKNIFITSAPLNNELIRFLKNRNIHILTNSKTENP